jgi:hypothetical protein
MGVVEIDLVEIGTGLGEFGHRFRHHDRDAVVRIGLPQGPVGGDPQDEVTDTVEAKKDDLHDPILASALGGLNLEKPSKTMAFPLT